METKLIAQGLEKVDADAVVVVLFEDEAAGALKIVDRRFVLDHKG